MPSYPLALVRLSALTVIVIVVPVVAVIAAVIAAMLVPMVFTIVRNIGIRIPVMPDEVDRLPAGVVLAAMMAPIALVTRAHMQINRRRQYSAVNSYANDGGAIDESRCGRIAHIDPSIKSGVTQVDRRRHLGKRCATQGHRGKSHREQ